MDPADEVEVADVEGAVRAAGKRHGGKQHHVPGGAAAARSTGDAAVEAVAHHGADDGRLLGEIDVLPVPFVQDPCTEQQKQRFSNKCAHLENVFFFVAVVFVEMNHLRFDAMSVILTV